MSSSSWRGHFIACMVAIVGICSWAAGAVAPAEMPPMEQVGPIPRAVDARQYARILHVAPDAEHRSVSDALGAIKDASKQNRYAILVAAGTYNESRIQLKPFVDLYGGFAPGGDWKTRDVYENATILDAQKKGPVVIGADDARIDGFVITNGHHDGSGGGIICDGTSPTIVNNIIMANNLPAPAWLKPPLGKQAANEGAGIALLNGSRAYVANNLICENTTDAGAGAGITCRNNVEAKILRNVFANNVAGIRDDTEFHGKKGSRSSPGGAIAVNAASSPQISFNAIVLGSAPINNDGGGIWVEGNSAPPINYNWIVGNLSGDDGGGIYVMGNLYYDEQGERHDLMPDAPVKIESNLIAGNQTIRGGPGGIRVSRWGRAELLRNVIVANQGGVAGREGGVITVMHDNVIADNQEDRSTSRPKIRLSGEIASRSFDQRRYVTEMTLSQDLPAAPQRRATLRDRERSRLEGGVIRVGQQWSVIKSGPTSANPKTIIVWGKVTDPATTFEILDHYVESDYVQAE
ncbi:right-handed parallel beta-helix repeat-containing protein [Fontivita pretiosa]|uniref:right-handed parallel beta-helix repeat-containing protein n=1 Tax=Fontivita pretiosa TaxID=2989684 RepID=UPI003D180D10